MKIGDTLRFDEPSVGTVLRVHSSDETYKIKRFTDGWRQLNIFDNPMGNPICWRSVISAWGPGSDPAIWFEVVELP